MSSSFFPVSSSSPMCILACCYTPSKTVNPSTNTSPQVDDNPEASAADATAHDAAQQQYSLWLSKQYSSYVSQLLQLCGSSSASLQVSAVSALMECVRHEAGAATFSNKLYGRVLTALVLSPHTSPEVS